MTLKVILKAPYYYNLKLYKILRKYFSFEQDSMLYKQAILGKIFGLCKGKRKIRETAKY